MKTAEVKTTWAEAFGKESDTVWPCERTMIIEYFYFIWDKVRKLKSLHHLGKLQSVNPSHVARAENKHRKSRRNLQTRKTLILHICMPYLIPLAF